MSVNCEVCYKKPQGESADVHREIVNKIGEGVLATPNCVVNKLKNTGSRIVPVVSRLFNEYCKYIQAGYTDAEAFLLSIYLSGFLKAVAIFRKPNAIPLCFSIGPFFCIIRIPLKARLK